MGEDYEDEVLEVLGEAFSKTANSGAMFDDADLKHPEFVVECKLRPLAAVSTSIPDVHLNQLMRQAVKLNKDWIFVKKVTNDLSLAAVDLNMLSMLISERDHYKTECAELQDRLDNAIGSTYGSGD